MRDSTRYLASIPAKFFVQLAAAFCILLAVYTLVESRAPAYGPIHDSFGFYLLLMAALPSLASLLAMMENYFAMRVSETNLARYLARLGIE